MIITAIRELTYVLCRIRCASDSTAWQACLQALQANKAPCPTSNYNTALHERGRDEKREVEEKIEIEIGNNWVIQ